MPQDILQFIDARFQASDAFTAAFPGNINFDRAEPSASRPYLLVSILAEANGSSTEEDTYSESVQVQFTIVADSIPEVRTLRQLLARDPDSGFDRIATESLGDADVCLTAMRTGGFPSLDPDPNPDAGELAMGTLDYLFVLSREDGAGTGSGSGSGAGSGASATTIGVSILPFGDPGRFSPATDEDGNPVSFAVGPEVEMPSAARITSASFACPVPRTAPASGTWTALVQVQPAGTTDPAAAVDVCSLAVDLAAAPIEAPFALAAPYAVAAGDVLRCGLVPVGSPTALDAPSFTVALGPP